jgi:hypothetical protein
MHASVALIWPETCWHAAGMAGAPWPEIMCPGPTLMLVLSWRTKIKSMC